MTNRLSPACFALLLLCFFSVPQFLPAQEAAAPGSSETKVDAIIKETQQTIGGKDTTGFVWWLPAEFWEQSAIEEGSSPEQARTNFAALHDYTMIIVAVGKVAQRRKFGQAPCCATPRDKLIRRWNKSPATPRGLPRLSGRCSPTSSVRWARICKSCFLLRKRNQAN